MENYDEIASQLKIPLKSKRASIFEPHFDLIVELLRRSVSKTKILEHVISIDQEISNKNQNTVRSLFSSFVNTKRVTDALYMTSNPVHIYAKKTVLVEKKVKEKETYKPKRKEQNKNEEKREEITPVAKQEGKPAVAKTTEEIVTNKGETSQQDEVPDSIAKVMANFQNRKRG